MAITKTVIARGPKNFVVHAFLEQDGVDQGELNNAVLIDPVEDLKIKKGAQLRLVEAWYSLAWFDLTLKFQGLVPRPIWTFTRDVSNHIDFTAIGGLADRAAQSPPLSDDTGRVLISTNGFAQLGSQGTLVLVFKF